MNTRTMKNTLYILSILLIAACNQSSTLQSKKDQLAQYREEADKLKGLISNLEKEIAAMDTAAVITEPKLVTLEAAQKSEFSHYIDLQGIIEAEDFVVVQPGIPGVVTRVLVKEGDKVSAGQILAETDNRAMQESVAQLQTNLELAKTAYEKQERLWKQKIGSEMQYLQAKTQYESLQKNLSSLQAQLDMTRIKSPIQGVVDAVNIKPGAYATPNMLGAFQVVNNNRLKVVLKLADSYISKVKQGAPVRVFLKELNDTIQGEVGFISKAVNSMTRTFTVEVKINGQEHADVRPNMLASVSINDENIKEAISVPSNLVQKDQNGQTYLLIADGEKSPMKVKKKFVVTGLSYGDKIVITNGLEEGDRLIRNGYQDLVEGQSITTL